MPNETRSTHAVYRKGKMDCINNMQSRKEKTKNTGFLLHPELTEKQTNRKQEMHIKEADRILHQQYRQGTRVWRISAASTSLPFLPPDSRPVL